jgi:hypothetical protein
LSWNVASCRLPLPLALFAALNTQIVFISLKASLLLLLFAQGIFNFPSCLFFLQHVLNVLFPLLNGEYFNHGGKAAGT